MNILYPELQSSLVCGLPKYACVFLCVHICFLNIFSLLDAHPN